MNENEPRMVVIAGPNGSGKSTVTQGLALSEKFPAQYINADDIAKFELKAVADPLARNRQAAELAEQRRKAALESGAPFAFETVLSTPGKLALFDEARDKGFSVDLIFITTANAAINTERVGFRVAKGGHPVPADKIAERYERAMQLLPSAIQKADTAEVYDNSSSERGPLLVAMKNGDHLDYDDAGLPWVTERLAKAFEDRAESRQKLADLVPGETVKEAHVGHSNCYRGVVLGVTEKHALQRTDDNTLVLHDLALCKPGMSLRIGQTTAISYDFGADGKHATLQRKGRSI
jgi:predicted ABC-type ATPase